MCLSLWTTDELIRLNNSKEPSPMEWMCPAAASLPGRPLIQSAGACWCPNSPCSIEGYFHITFGSSSCELCKITHPCCLPCLLLSCHGRDKDITLGCHQFQLTGADSWELYCLRSRHCAYPLAPAISGHGQGSS